MIWQWKNGIRELIAIHIIMTKIIVKKKEVANYINEKDDDGDDEQ